MDIIKKLPEELRHYILSFTYEPQPFVLLNDIRHYGTSRLLIQEYYMQHFEYFEDQLYHDLIGFCNQRYKLKEGYREIFFGVFLRLFSFKNISRSSVLRLCVNIFIVTKRANNIVWGLLTEEERNTFLGQII